MPQRLNSALAQAARVVLAAMSLLAMSAMAPPASATDMARPATIAVAGMDHCHPQRTGHDAGVCLGTMACCVALPAVATLAPLMAPRRAIPSDADGDTPAGRTLSPPFEPPRVVV